VKIFLSILFVLILPTVLFAQREGVSSDGKTFRATRTIKYEADVKDKLQIDKSFQFIELGIFPDGYSEKSFSEINAVDFSITGSADEEVNVTLRMTIEEKEIRLMHAALEAQLNSLWVRVPCDMVSQEGTLTIYSCHYFLSSSGNRIFRFFPISVTASDQHVSSGETSLLIIQISCEYTV
jgi:hypothetical protein